MTRKRRFMAGLLALGLAAGMAPARAAATFRRAAALASA
ncbi:hypothetical protein J2X73_001644 [Novosphingobium sp. 1748]|nr:hypothetical protein [Novosphingobium sp. 1748]